MFQAHCETLAQKIKQGWQDGSVVKVLVVKPDNLSLIFSGPTWNLSFDVSHAL